MVDKFKVGDLVCYARYKAYGIVISTSSGVLPDLYEIFWLKNQKKYYHWKNELVKLNEKINQV